MALMHTTELPLKYGVFRISYHSFSSGDCVSVSLGDLEGVVPVVRIHSSCLFGESFHALGCDCADQLVSTLKLIKKNRSGIIVYQHAEGRGIGLKDKIKALELQRTQRLNTVEAFSALGFHHDLRTYDKEIAALDDLHVNKTIKVAGQNPHKVKALERAGFTIAETIHPAIRITKHNIHELITKRDIMGYDIRLDDISGIA